MQLEKPKILERFVKGKNGVAKITTILIAIGLLAVPFLLFLTNEASAATIVTEDFEDISDWVIQGTTVTQSAWTKVSGTYSLHVADDGSNYGYLYQNITLSDTAMTVDFYFYYNDTGSTQGIVMIRTADTSVKINHRVYSDGTLQVVIAGNAVNIQTVSPGVWYHVRSVWDSGTYKIYVNDSSGVLQEVINGTYTTGTTYEQVVTPSSTSATAIMDIYIDDLTIYDTAEYPNQTTTTIDIAISISPDNDGDGRISFGSTNQTNVSMDSIDYIQITENGDATVTTLTITMQNIGGIIPTYYGGATNCYVYQWVGAGAPTEVNLSDPNWQQVASFDATYTATITGLSLGQGQSIYLAFRILDNDPENDGLAAGTYESTTTAHSITAS